MIGIGIWEIPVNSMFFKGTAQITVRDVNGDYDFSFSLPGHALPEFDIYNIVTEGNTLSADATCDLLRGKSIHVEVTFDGDRCSGIAKGPMGVKIKIDGKRIG